MQATRQRGTHFVTILIEVSTGYTILDTVIAGYTVLLLYSILLELPHLGLDLIVEELHQLWFSIGSWVSDIVETKDT
jgi:hypothetical protein